MTPESLVKFIRQHDPCDAFVLKNGDLRVITDEVHADGTVHRVYETIPATLKAVRDWLGY